MADQESEWATYLHQTAGHNVPALCDAHVPSDAVVATDPGFDPSVLFPGAIPVEPVGTRTQYLYEQAKNQLAGHEVCLMLVENPRGSSFGPVLVEDLKTHPQKLAQQIGDLDISILAVNNQSGQTDELMRLIDVKQRALHALVGPEEAQKLLLENMAL